MKFKNISVLEQHVEKIIIACCAVSLLTAGYIYVVTDRFPATFSGRQVSYTKLDSMINNRAVELEDKLDAKTLPAELHITEIPDYAGWFADEYATSNTTDLLTIVSIPNMLVSVEGSLDREDHSYYEPIIPSPRYLTHRRDIATLDPVPVLSDSVLSGYFGTTSPFNVQWVSLSARLNVKKLHEALSHESADARRMPKNWWRTTLSLVDVQVEREELLEDGNWGERHIIDPLPGSVHTEIRAAVDKIKDAASEAAYITFLRSRAADIAQPEFFDLLSRDWMAVKVDAPYITDDDDDQMRQDKERIIELIAELAREERRAEGGVDRSAEIDVLRGEYNVVGTKILGNDGVLPEDAPEMNASNQQPRTSSRTSVSSTGSRPSSGVSPSRSGMSPSRSGMSPSRSGVSQMSLSGVPTPTRLSSASRSTSRPRRHLDFLLDSEDLMNVDLWAHDITLDPGNTYRYRMRVAVVNPLFGQKIALPEEQYERVGTQFSITGQWSAWSDEVQTIQKSYFFLVGGETEAGLATIEIWKFSEGKWHKAIFNSVRPGDQIGAVVPNPRTLIGNTRSQGLTVDFNIGKSMVDIDSDIIVLDNGDRRHSPRLLYLDDGRIRSRHRLVDVDELKDTLTAIEETVPDEVAAALKAREAVLAERARERDRILDSTRNVSRPTSTTPTTGSSRGSQSGGGANLRR